MVRVTDTPSHAPTRPESHSCPCYFLKVVGGWSLTLFEVPVPAPECKPPRLQVFECARRVLLTSANVFTAHLGFGPQIGISVLLCLLSIKAQAFFQPFLIDGDDILSEVSQAIVILSFIVTWIMASGATELLGMIFIGLQLLW